MLRFSKALGAAIVLLGGGGLLGGCSNGYLDQRDAVSRSAGDAIATNKVTQMVDPWPAYSANTQIGFNGQKMQGAVERYRENRVTPLSGTGTSTTYQQVQQSSSGSGPSNAAPVGATVTQGVK